MNTLDLNGNWKIRWSDQQRDNIKFAQAGIVDEDRYMDARVPGEVHLDLWKAGLITDPYVGLNVLSARWVEESYWTYCRYFSAPPEALLARAWLVFEGLDLNAVIFLNGNEIGRHANSFYPCRVEVTGLLLPGENYLAVTLESGLYGVSDKVSEGMNHSEDQKLHKRHWLRKPQCQASWDWSPRLLNVGIHKPVRLEWSGSLARPDQLVPLVELSQDLQNGLVNIHWFVEGLTEAEQRGTITTEIPELGVQTTGKVTLRQGLQMLVGRRLKVPQPELWWPVGHGSQKLYDLKVSVSVQGAVVAETSTRIGFRHVAIRQDKHPEEGKFFVIEVNRRPIFCKGGNFVPADMIIAALDEKRYEKLVDLALELNFNILRIWGGGQYESDDFYRLCDEKGILVWQEFIFACGKYPLFDKAFYEDVKREAAYQVRRLAKHPSLVVWCGNNEMDWANWNWGYDKGVVFPDHALFHLVLPRLLAEEDPTRYYQPSSPFSPDHLNPGLHEVGDQHPWEIGFGDTDFRKYRSFISRFPNEGGCLGPTALPTMLASLAGEENIGSFIWQQHDNSIALWKEPSPNDLMLKQWLGKDMRKMSIEEYTYWGGLLQGEALKEYIDNYHRRMFDSASAIFWMYNDTWPAVRSWTVVDYYLRRTPSFMPVKRAFSRVAVVLAVDGDVVRVFGVNETQDTVSADLQYGLFNTVGGYLLDEHKTVNLPANASTRLAEIPMEIWDNPQRQIAFAMISRAGEMLARNRLILPFFKELTWAPADIHVHRQGDTVVLESDVFVWGVCLDLDGEEPLADNFFDLYPNIPYRLAWPAKKPFKITHTGNLV